MKQRSSILLVFVLFTLVASACAALPPVLVASTPVGGQLPEQLTQATPEAELPAGPDLNDPLPLDPALFLDMPGVTQAIPVSKAYKLVTLMALCQEGTLRTGTTVAATADLARALIAGDPRLRADLDAGIPDEVGADFDVILAADVIELYPRCRTEGMRWILVEARDRVMPEISPSLAGFATGELRRRGIEIRTGTTLEAVTATTAQLSGGETVPTRTVVWTAGVRPTPVIAELGLELGEGGRLAVDETLRCRGCENVWAIGDAAAVDDPARRGNVCPPTAQHAIRQGRLVGRNVAASIGSGEVRRFRYRTRGVFVDMGGSDAVASTMGIRWRGLPAWFLARSYHLAMLPGLKRKARLLIDWNVQLLFGRDASELGQLGHPPPLAWQITTPLAGSLSATRSGTDRIVAVVWGAW